MKLNKYIRKNIIITGVTLFSVLLCLSFATYSLFFQVEETEEEVITYGDLKIDFENDTDIISRTNDSPLTENEGKQTEPYSFTVTNTGTLKAKYTVIIEDDTEYITQNNLTKTNDNYIKYTLNDSDAKILGDIENNELITGVLEPGESIKYNMRFWLKEDAPNDALGSSMVKKVKLKGEYIPELEEGTLLAEAIKEKYSEDNEEGLIKVEQPATEQMKATTEYRYSGSNNDVNNYLEFNNELWRVIGVFDVDDGSGSYEQRVKIIRDESIGYYSWDSSASDVNSGYGINQWGESEDASGNAYTGADLKTLLNTTYYNRTTSDTCYNGQNNIYTSCDFSANGLSETAQNMIDDAKWYTAGVDYDKTTSVTYTEERSNALPPTGAEIEDNDTIKRTKNWTGKLALPYPSDYGYASSSCYNANYTLGWSEEATSTYNSATCTSSNWLHTGDYYDYYWTLSPRVSYPNIAFFVTGDGDVLDRDACDTYGVRPTVYLIPEVKLASGSGKKNDPYKVKIDKTEETESTETTKNYMVNATITNGTISGSTTKMVTENGNVTFNYTLNDSAINPEVVCTNGQNGSLNDGVLTVSNVTGNTTCSIVSSYQEYGVNVTVLNGTINGDTTKIVKKGQSATFTVNPSEGYGTSEVTCTNGQTASISGNTLTTGNITSDTTCTVTYIEIMPASDTIITKYSENNTEGLIKVDQLETDQMKATTEYRYSGSNDEVNNYVNFNNEIWRIIGVFDVDDGSGNYEQRVKIIREESVGDYSWDSSASDVNSGYGINQWGESEDASGNAYTGADLKTLLNTTYYNRTTSDTCYIGQSNAYTSCDFGANGLSETAQNMIDDAKWYTAGVNTKKTTPVTYTEERSNALPPTGEEHSNSLYNDTITRKGNWIGKVALIYPSDYGYASSSCYNTDTTLYYYEECTDSNWLYTGNKYWTLSPYVTLPTYAFVVYDSGRVNQYLAYWTPGVRPVVYLKSSVKITGGTGADAENAYELSL